MNGGFLIKQAGVFLFLGGPIIAEKRNTGLIGGSDNITYKYTIKLVLRGSPGKMGISIEYSTE